MTNLASRQTVAWPDRMGTWASTLCVVHCLLMPIVLSLSAVAVHVLPSEERTHRALAVLVALLGTIALVRGYRRHRRPEVILWMAAGVGCIAFTAAFGDELPSHWIEVSITLLGSVLMITAHRRNHTFCSDCACAAGR